MKIIQERKTVFILFFFLIGCFSSYRTEAFELEEAAELKAVQKSKQWSKQELLEAVNLFTEAGKQRVVQNDFKVATNNFLQTGKIYLQLGDKKNARFYFEKSRWLAQKSSLVDMQIESLGELALLEIDNGNITSCKKYLDEANKISSKHGNSKTSSLILFAASEYHYYQREFSTSISDLNKAIILLENTEFSEDRAKYLLNLGYAYIAIDDKDKATTSFYKSLEIFKSIKNVRGEVFTYIALGFAFSNYYEKQKSLDLYKQAEKLFIEDIDLDKKAMLYNGLGRVYMDFGEWQYALDCKNKALDLYKKTDNKFGIIATLASIAILNTLNNPNDKIVNLNSFNFAYKFAQSVKDYFYVSIILQEIGNYYFRLNDFDNALSYYEKSLPYFQKVKDKREISYINARTSQIFLQNKDISTARKKLLQALKLNQEISDRISEAETLYLIATIDLTENKASEGLKNIKKSIYLTEVLYSEVANSKLKSTYLSNVFDRYELYINLLMNRHKESPNENFAIEALQATEKSRARAILENLALSEADFTKDADAETVKREKEIRILLNSKTNKLTDLLSSNAVQSETEKLDSEINELEHELEDIKATLKQNSPIYSAIKNPAPFDVGEFQRDILDENSLLLEFSFGKKESYLWAVSKTGVDSYVLPPREEIESHIEKLRELIAEREMKLGETVEDYRRRISQAEDVYKFESRKLSDELFGQIADTLGNKRLVIVPDGKLHYFPVAALPMPNSADDTPILLTNETIYEPSAATLALLTRNGRKTSTATKNLLVFSDPIFSNQDVRITKAEPTDEIKPDDNSLKVKKLRFVESLNAFARLNASKDEAESIVEIVGADESTALNGATATRERALDISISDYKIIHFATHGLIKEDRPELSGIVLSQVDESGQSLNGVLRLQDIYAMNLAADAVVLSACSTGIGKEVKGEGLMSLNNAFLQAGAKSVVSSLWKVDDYAAQELMKNFYLELSSGKVSTSEAMRQAQIKLRQNPRYQSPFYWAAFTVQGGFQTPVIINNKSFRIDYRWIFAVLCLIGAFALAIKYRKKIIK